MQTNLENLGQDLGREILRRNPLKQHSVDYVQREGLVTVYRWDPNRPASGASWSGNQPTAKKIPMTVNGRRIAVIDVKAGSIDALVVGRYVNNSDSEVAVASPNSYAVRWDLVSGQIVVHQINNRYEVSLSGKEVVGITKGEMTLLRYLAANQPLQSVPQNL